MEFVSISSSHWRGEVLSRLAVSKVKDQESEGGRIVTLKMTKTKTNRYNTGHKITFDDVCVSVST